MTDPRIRAKGAGGESRGGGLAARAVILFLCAGVLTAGLMLSPPSESRYCRLLGFDVPDSCMFRATVGLPCPGCGLIRSFVAALHGDWAESFRYNRVGPLVLAYVVLQALHNAAEILFPSWRTRGAAFGRRLDQSVVLVAVLLVLNWIPDISAKVFA